MKKFIYPAAILASLSLITAAQAGPDPSVIQKKFEKSFPNLKVESVQETPLKGIYEVVLSMNQQIMYYSPKGYVFVGDLWSETGTSITADRKGELLAAKAKRLPLEKALKIGSGKKTVIEFVDPKCPASRMAYQDISKHKDITQYVFLFPLETIRPGARELSKYVLCSSDPAKALDAAMRGDLDGKGIELPPGCTDEAVDSQLSEARTLGIAGTPALFVDGKYAGGTKVMEVYPKLLSQSSD